MMELASFDLWFLYRCLWWLLAVVTSAISVGKIWDTGWRYNRWIFKHGEQYKADVIKLFYEEEDGLKIDLTKLRETDEKHRVPWSPIWSGRFDKVGRLPRFILGNLYRNPLLIVIMAILLALQPLTPSALPVFAGSVVIILLVAVQLIQLFLSRLILGFVDNTRRDFSINPVQGNSGPVLWDNEQSLVRVVTGTGVMVVALIIGFAGIYSGLFAYCPREFQGLVDEVPYQLQFLYFSVVTFATVGYGDIKPALGSAQVAVTLEILFCSTVLVFFLFALAQTIQPNRHFRKK